MAKLITSAQPHMPWQDRPQDSTAAIWRYNANPILTPADVPHANSVFNSAVTPFGSGYAGVFRCDSRALQMDIYVGFSNDGLDWDIDDHPIVFEGVGDAITTKQYRYDPRVIFIEDRYYISWCNGYHGPTIGLGYTFDFKTFYQLENMFLPFNRNGVMFPRKIGDNYAVLSRPSDNGHTPFGDIYYSESPDLTYWGKHRFVMGTTDGWQSTKIGPGPCPLETDEGWLLYYHGVITTCNGFVYRMGAALLDIEEPWKVIARSSHYLMGPEEEYERTGDVPNVFFPCGVVTDGPTGRIAIYYGGADTVVGVAFTDVDSTLEYLWKHNMV